MAPSQLPEDLRHVPLPAAQMLENTLLTRARCPYDAGARIRTAAFVMELFPISVSLKGRKTVVVGAGNVAAAKADGLLRAGAALLVVAPRATDWIQAKAAEKVLAWQQREFQDSDLEDSFLVIAATNRREVNQRVFHAARERGVLCNVVDDPEHCDFFYPAVVQRGALQIAISTGGQSPALAHRLRVELEQQFGPEYDEWVEQVGRLRREILARDLPDDQQRELLEQIASPAAFKDFVRARSGGATKKAAEAPARE